MATGRFPPGRWSFERLANYRLEPTAALREILRPRSVSRTLGGRSGLLVKKPQTIRDFSARVVRDLREWRRIALGMLNVGVTIFMLCGCGTYGRMLLHGRSGVEDYRIFPGREIEASPRAFFFATRHRKVALPIT
jgi:hypothetical protein